MPGKKILLYIILFYWSLSIVKAQNPNYEVVAIMDTLTKSMHVSTKISIPALLNIPHDTVWFHLWANAFSNTASEFTEEQLKFGLTDHYFRNKSKLSKISDLKIYVHQQEVPYMFKDESDEILGVIVSGQELYSGEILIEYQLRLPDLINGLGYEKGNFYLRNFYPKLVRYENKVWQTYHYRQFADEWGYNTDVLLKLYGMEGYVPFSIGNMVNDVNSFEISANNVKELAIVMLKNENIHLLMSSVNENFSYRLISFSDHSLNQVDVDTTIQKVAFRMSAYLGQYPFESFNIFIGEDCSTCFNTDGMVMVNEPKEGETLEQWLVSILSDAWVSSKFNVNTENYPWLKGGLRTYFQDIYHQDFQTNVGKYDGEFKSFYFSYLYWVQRLRMAEPLNARRIILDKDHEFLNRYYKPAALLHYLSALVGDENFSATLSHFTASKEPLTPDNLIEKLEQISGKELQDVAESYISKLSETDYKILQMNYEEGKLQLSVENQKSDALPFILTLETKAGMKTDFLVNGFSGEKTILLDYDHQDEIKMISIDNAGFLPEINREDNHFFPNKTFKHGPLKITDLFKDGDSRKKEIRITPFPLYNDNDGVMMGINFTNSNFEDIHTLSYARSEERRVGKECRSRWSPYH